MVDYRRVNGTSIEELSAIALDLCVTLQIQPEVVCQGLIELNVATFIYIIDERPQLTAQTMCGLILQSENCVIVDEDFLEFSIDIDTNGSPIQGHKGGPGGRRDDDLNIYHISDVHFDPDYVIGSKAVCDEPVCCRTGIPDSPVNATQKWGGWLCDTPWDAVVDVFNHVNDEHHDIDFIYYTGDIIDHGVWETTEERITTSITRIYGEMSNVFGDIPIYPILGNHEGQPVNQFPPEIVPEEFTVRWLYGHVANTWSKWLPESALETVRRGGYYTVLARPGLRVVALNNNDCYTFNWWLFFEPTHPAAQLQWLHDTLLTAEANNEKVHILAHIPSGERNCFYVWSREYNRIINRFWNTISGIFNGHTHNDQFIVIYDDVNAQNAVNVAWNGGSATTYTDVNHNYKHYYVNSETFDVVDMDVFIYNLTEANLTPNQNPRWFKTYTFSEEYDQADLSPAGLNNLVEGFANDADRLNNFWVNKVKKADTALATGCNNNCLADHLCQLVVSAHADTRRCDELVAIFESGLN